MILSSSNPVCLNKNDQNIINRGGQTWSFYPTVNFKYMEIKDRLESIARKRKRLCQLLSQIRQLKSSILDQCGNYYDLFLEYDEFCAYVDSGYCVSLEPHLKKKVLDNFIKGVDTPGYKVTKFPKLIIKKTPLCKQTQKSS